MDVMKHNINILVHINITHVLANQITEKTNGFKMENVVNNLKADLRRTFLAFSFYPKTISAAF